MWVRERIHAPARVIRDSCTRTRTARTDLHLPMFPSIGYTLQTMAEIASCPHFPRCTGCTAIGVDYAIQLATKLQAFRRTLAASKLRTVQADAVESITRSPTPHHYRNRVKLVPRESVTIIRRSMSAAAKSSRAATTGSVSLGLYESGSHDVVDIPTCPVQLESINRVVEVVRRGLDSCRVDLYDERTHRGSLRFVSVRAGQHTGQVLVGLVTRDPSYHALSKLARYIMTQDEDVVGVVQNINPHRSNVIFGRTDHTVAGCGVLEEVVCGVPIRLGLTSFFQVNTSVAELAYRAIRSNLLDRPGCNGTPSPAKTALLDLYSGVGVIGLLLADAVHRVVSVESDMHANSLARASAALNKCDNIEHREGLVEDVVTDIVGRLRRDHGRDTDIVAAVNPPRRGLDTRVVESLADAGVRRIAYLSCAPDTLMRDLARFEKRGYCVRHIELFDMFPQTPKTETLAIVDRESPDLGGGGIEP